MKTPPKPVKNPCTKTCPKRDMWCHSTCPDYKEYREYNEWLYEQRKNAVLRGEVFEE